MCAHTYNLDTTHTHTHTHTAHTRWTHACTRQYVPDPAWQQLRGAALASSHTPLLAFSKGNNDKSKAAGGGGTNGAAISPTREKGPDKAGGSGECTGVSGKAQGSDASTSGGIAGVGKDGGGGSGGGGVKKGKGGEENLIVIHVCDENRGINRDFTCRKDVLLSEMGMRMCVCVCVCVCVCARARAFWRTYTYVSLSVSCTHARTHVSVSSQKVNCSCGTKKRR